MTMRLHSRYELQEQIGQGAFAAVWRAHDEKLNRPVAVKLLSPHLLEMEGAALARQFQQEAQTVARLEHPHIVNVYDSGQEGSQLFLVMPYLPGGHLGEKLAAHGPYNLPDLLPLLRPIADALDAAHAAGLVHRDVKPQNILFDKENRPLLTDFGLVKLLSGASYATNLAFSGGRTVGTPEYMAPEQAHSRPVDGRTDVYALAVVVFHLLTGAPPFQGESALSTLFLAAGTPREQLRPRLPADLPPGAADCLLAGMSIEPDGRPATPGAFMTALEETVTAVTRAQQQQAAATAQAALVRNLQRERIQKLEAEARRAHEEEAWERLRGLAHALLLEDENHRPAQAWLAELETRSPYIHAPIDPAIQRQPATTKTDILTSIKQPDYIDITADMSPQEVRRARIHNAKAKLAYHEALRAAGIDPATRVSR